MGLEPKDHHLLTIEDSSDGKIGVIWLHADLESPVPSGYIFDLYIEPAFRRKGYARQAILQLEATARGLGLKKIALHVFAHNHGARALYEKLGYQAAA